MALLKKHIIILLGGTSSASGSAGGHGSDLKLRNGVDFFLLRTGSPNRLQLGH